MRCARLLLFLLACCLGGNSSLIADDEDDSNPGKTLRVVIKSVKPPVNAGATAVLNYGLTREDYRRIKDLAGDHRITPIRELPHEARVGDRTTEAALIGTTPDYAATAGLIERGRFLTDKDLRQLNNVAVLSSKVAKELFPFEAPVGKNVRVGKNYYLVVGVAKEGFGRTNAGEVQRNRKPLIYIPISTMRSRMGDRVMRTEAGSLRLEEYELSRIEVDVPVADADRISVAIGGLLRESHDPKDFQIQIKSLNPSGRTP
jgi:putative ABC transport system permease protein